MTPPICVLLPGADMRQISPVGNPDRRSPAPSQKLTSAGRIRATPSGRPGNPRIDERAGAHVGYLGVGTGFQPVPKASSTAELPDATSRTPPVPRSEPRAGLNARKKPLEKADRPILGPFRAHSGHFLGPSESWRWMESPRKAACTARLGFSLEKFKYLQHHDLRRKSARIPA